MDYKQNCICISDTLQIEMTPPPSKATAPSPPPSPDPPPPNKSPSPGEFAPLSFAGHSLPASYEGGGRQERDSASKGPKARPSPPPNKIKRRPWQARKLVTTAGLLFWDQRNSVCVGGFRLYSGLKAVLTCKCSKRDQAQSSLFSMPQTRRLVIILLGV